MLRTLVSLNVRVYTVRMKDYAYPTLMAEKCLKLLHQAVLDKRMDEAMKMAIEAMRWTVEIQESLKEMDRAAKS